MITILFSAMSNGPGPWTSEVFFSTGYQKKAGEGKGVIERHEKAKQNGNIVFKV